MSEQLYRAGQLHRRLYVLSCSGTVALQPKSDWIRLASTLASSSSPHVRNISRGGDFRFVIRPKMSNKRAEWQRRHEELCLRGEPYWSDQLERWLNRFGPSSCDLPELEAETAKTPKQVRLAVRLRHKFLVRRMREIAGAHEDQDEAADQVWEMLRTTGQVRDAVEWCRIDRSITMSGDSDPSTAQSEDWFGALLSASRQSAFRQEQPPGRFCRRGKLADEPDRLSGLGTLSLSANAGRSAPPLTATVCHCCLTGDDIYGPDDATAAARRAAALAGPPPARSANLCGVEAGDTNSTESGRCARP